MSNNLGELVKAAKGEDRSIREYAQASGVDAAVISKIMSGKYIPKNSKVLMKLTDIQAAPRNGITYEKLVKSSNADASYKAGVMAGMGAASVALSAIGAMPVIGLPVVLGGAAIATTMRDKNEKQNELINKTVNNIQRFSAMAIGLIYGKLAQRGIIFKQEVEKCKRLLENEFDTYLSIKDEQIEEYVMGYVYLDEEEQRSDFIVENVGKRAIERFVFLIPNKRRKISIIVNCKSVYEYLLKFKGQISYRGYLSVVLLNDDTVTIEKEEFLAWYYENEEIEPISLM